MRLKGSTFESTLLVVAILAIWLPTALPAQAPASADGTPAASSQPATPAESPAAATDPAPATSAVPPSATAVAQRTYTVPAGTKILLQLRSSLNTRSAKPGDGVYLSSAFPVVVGNRVMIPAGVFVQGTVDRVVRAGRVKGKAQLDMHFTSIIFPNGTVVEIPGMVSGMPGASKQKVKGDEGTIEQDSDKTRNAAKTAEIALPTGATVGSIAGLGGGHPLAGSFEGLGAGLAAVALVSLFTRGADVNIESGTQVEMVLQRPLILEQENLAEGTAPGGAPAMVPTANQPKPLQKPGRPNLLCPPGSLGCQ
ncbi:MAG TPA: TrbI/VirB10 family protein [Terracidiphilus sp.]|jgi:type IV secretion system protein VirB10